MKKVTNTAEITEQDTLKYVMTLWLMAANKGGVAKTGTAALMAETCLASGWSYVIFDTDIRNKSRIAEAYDGHVVSYVDENKNIDNAGRTLMFDLLAALMDQADRARSGDNKAKPVQHVIFDVGAGEITRFLEILEKEGIFDRLVAGGHRIRLVHPIADDPYAFEGIDALIKDTQPDGIYGPYEIKTVATLCAGVSASPERATANRIPLIDLQRDFPMWFRSGERDLARAAGWSEYLIPILESMTAYDAWGKYRKEVKPVTMNDWARADLGPSMRRDQMQMTRWLNRAIPATAKVME